MNAIVPRQTIEQVVMHYERTMDLFGQAFLKIKEADEAIKEAHATWELAAPGKPSRIYHSGPEIEAFRKAVDLPNEQSYMTSARRLVSITVWEHIIRMTKIESLMDSQEVKKLEEQMRYREPSYGHIDAAIARLENLVAWFAEDHPSDSSRWNNASGFVRNIKEIAGDLENCPAIDDDRMNAISVAARNMISALEHSSEYVKNWTGDIEEAVATIERERHVNRGLPPITVENIMATVQGLLGQADAIFVRSVVNTFTKLDRRFRSHDGFKIGSRVIFERCFSDFGTWNGYGYGAAQQRILDIERIFQVLDRKNRLTNEDNHDAEWLTPASLIWHIDQNRAHRRAQSEIESAFFKVRIFMNGNMHLWMKRKDLLNEVNRILAGYYGEVIGDKKNDGHEEDPLESRKTTPAKYYGFFPSPEVVVERVWQKVGVYNDDNKPTTLEPSAGTGALARVAVSRGYPTDCIELQPHLAAGLEGQGYRRVLTADFINVPPNPVYDLVIMNPPFDRERDIDHVTHALKFLKPTGKLVAVMSAGTEWRSTKKSRAFQALMERMNATWTDLPAGAFSEQGTNVNTVVVSVFKDGRRQSRW